MTEATREAKAQLDERRVARAVAIGLPIVTVTLAAATGVIASVATAILVLTAGALMGVVALFWASLRVLSGDAPLPPELEALDAPAHGVDALASRKKMLLRALKDLENERALGKLDAEDFAQVSETYRNELKEVLASIDATLAPYRDKADEAARAHLAAKGLVETAYRGNPPPADEGSDLDVGGVKVKIEKLAEALVEGAPVVEGTLDGEKVGVVVGVVKVVCGKCGTQNDDDAKFCKKCGGTLEAKSDAS
jgi:hypothetical protein